MAVSSSYLMHPSMEKWVKHKVVNKVFLPQNEKTLKRKQDKESQTTKRGKGIFHEQRRKTL